MAGGRRAIRFRQVRLGLVLLATILPALGGCTFASDHYLPADTAIDPYGTVRTRAEEFYQAGLTREGQGDWRKALDNYRQARLWDPDGRQDIKTALNRAQEHVDSLAAAPQHAPTPRPQPPLAAGQTPAPTAPAAGRTPVPPRTASKPGMRQFHSDNFPYTISYPTDWLAKPAGSTAAPIDMFAATQTRGGAAVVMIMVEPTKASLDTLYVVLANELASQGATDVQIAARRQIDDLPADVLTYHVTSEPVAGISGKSSVRHAIFVTPGFAWHVVLLATPATTPDLVKTFDAMLDSMDLQASATPVQ